MIDALVLINANIPAKPFSQLFLVFKRGFTGTGPILTGTLIDQAGAGAAITGGGSTPVPEPIDINAPFSQFVLEFTHPYTGVGVATAGSYITQTGPGLSVTSGGSTAVPEPITLTGTAVAGVMGVFLKRKQKASKAA